MTSIGKLHACALSILWHGIHWSSTCPQAEMCPTCKTKNHSLNYIFPMLQEAKYEDKGYRVYWYDDPPKQVNDR